MLRVLTLPTDRPSVNDLLRRLKLDPADLALLRGDRADKARAVAHTLEDVANRGDDALVDSARKFDDPTFEASKLRVTQAEMDAAHARIASDRPALITALKRSIAQVREYQTHILPKPTSPLERPGFTAALRWTALDSAGVYFPGGKASYPSSLIMLAVPAQVAGVKRVIACTPPSRHFSDVVLAAARELELSEMYRIGGVAAFAAMALGTQTVRPVDKVVGPGNEYVQLAKRAVSGAVGIDAFLGPSEILTLADDSADPITVAADLLAQAEHDPGTCFLLTTSRKVIDRVGAEISRQIELLPRADAIRRSMQEFSVAILCPDEAAMLALANEIACEHVSVRTSDPARTLGHLRHAGCVFVGDHSPVAAGDYIAGPSHCLPTNTTARFASGVSVYEFLKRSSIVTYGPQGIAADAPAIATIAGRRP